jgi:hypothetical protein
MPACFGLCPPLELFEVEVDFLPVYALSKLLYLDIYGLTHRFNPKLIDNLSKYAKFDPRAIHNTPTLKQVRV